MDWKDAFGSMQERMKYLLESGHNSDIQFLVGNEATGKKLINGHKFVLGTIGSTVFEAQFRTNESNDWPKDKPIEVIDVDPDAFKAMLKYLYLEDLSDITKENAANVLAVAKRYLLNDFAKKCVELAFQMLDVENALGISKVAEFHLEQALAEHCWAFVDRNIEQIVVMDEFLMLSQKEVKELFERGTLQCNELKLFQGLDRWAHYQCQDQNIHPNGEQKRAIMGTALNAIRFPLIHSADFINQIVSTGILTDKEMLCIVLHNSEDTNAQMRKIIPLPFSAEQRAAIPVSDNNKWNGQDCSPLLSISKNGFALTYFRSSNENNSVRAIWPIPHLNLKGKKPYIAAYFEVKIIVKSNCNIGIGFCDREYPLMGTWIGNCKNSIAFWRKKRMYIDGIPIQFENGIEGLYKEGEVIGIGLIHSPTNSSLKCFASLNGHFFGSANLPSNFFAMKLFPVVTLCREGDSIEANFGNAWRYNPQRQLVQ